MSRLPLLALPLAAALLAPGAAGAAACAGADTPLDASAFPAARAAVLCIVNAERTARGLPAVRHQDELELAAQRHSDDMVARDYFEHVAPDGSSPGDRIEAAGYDWWAYGENIAVGFRTPRAVMEGWMRSPGHCRNVLGPNFTQLGVGVATVAATIGGGVGTWTQDFGRPAGVPAPSTDTGPQDACSTATTLIGLDPPATPRAPGGRRPRRREHARRGPADDGPPRRPDARPCAAGCPRPTACGCGSWSAAPGAWSSAARPACATGAYLRRVRRSTLRGRLEVTVRVGTLRVTRTIS